MFDMLFLWKKSRIRICLDLRADIWGLLDGSMNFANQ